MECTSNLKIGVIPGRSKVLVDYPLFKNLLKKQNLQSDNSIVYNYQERELLAVIIKFTAFVLYNKMVENHGNYFCFKS